MVTWRDVIDQEERRAEAMRQAENWRLARAVGGTSQTGANRVAAFMIRLGAWMERTGCHLQTRFKALERQAVMNTSAPSATLGGCP